MIKLRVKMGRWKDETFDRQLVYEICPGACIHRELHYPTYMKSVCCPECKTSMEGAELLNLKERVKWHKGV